MTTLRDEIRRSGVEIVPIERAAVLVSADARLASYDLRLLPAHSDGMGATEQVRRTLGRERLECRRALLQEAGHTLLEVRPAQRRLHQLHGVGGGLGE